METAQCILNFHGGLEALARNTSLFIRHGNFPALAIDCRGIAPGGLNLSVSLYFSVPNGLPLSSEIFFTAREGRAWEPYFFRSEFSGREINAFRPENRGELDPAVVARLKRLAAFWDRRLERRGYLEAVPHCGFCPLFASGLYPSFFPSPDLDVENLTDRVFYLN